MKKVTIISILICVVISAFSQKRTVSVLVDLKEIKTALNIEDSILLSTQKFFLSSEEVYGLTSKYSFNVALESYLVKKFSPKSIVVDIYSKKELKEKSKILVFVFIESPNIEEGCCNDRIYLGVVPAEIVIKNGFFWLSPV